MRFLFRFIPILLLCSSVWAVPDAVNRSLCQLDFEERRLGNNEPLPMHWNKVRDRLLPHYVNGYLTTDQARSGRYSFRFDLNGGGLVYRYESDQLTVQLGAHYRVETYVKTTALKYARARLSAFFTDQDHRPIAASLTHSPLYAASDENQPWKQLDVELSTTNENAAYLVIELALLQPEQYTPTTLGDRALFSQDIRGSAWFDDVKVSQVPKVGLKTNQPGNIFPASQALRIIARINDRFTDDLSGRLIVQDAQNQVVYQRSGVLDLSAATPSGPGEYELALTLPTLAPGWYRATMQISSRGESVGDHVIDFIRLADDRVAGHPDERFGVIATDLPFAGWDDLPQVLSILSVGRVKVGLWNQQGDVMQIDSKILDRLLEGLRERSILPTACLVELPPEITHQLTDPTWKGLLKAQTSQWQDQLSQLIARYAYNLAAWQLGADGSDLFVANPAMHQVYNMFYQQFSSLIDKPDLAMPWPAWYELEGGMPATVALSLPPSVLPSQIPLYMADMTQRHTAQPVVGSPIKGSPELSVSLQLLDEQRYGRELQIRDLAQRVIYALSADAHRIDIPLPFTIETQGGQVIRQPREMFLIVRTLTRMLSGATFKGRVPVADGVEAFLFDRAGVGILALWSQDNQRQTRPLRISPLTGALRLDLWGNVTPISFTAREQSDPDTVDLPIDAMPTFIVGVDANLAQMRASVSWDQPLLESSFKPHLRKIRFANPYRQAISGQLKLKAPPGWTLSPPTFQFSLNPGEVFQRDLTIELPYNSLGGEKIVKAEFQVQADRSIGFQVDVPLKLGLSDVGMQTLALRDGDDIIVQQIISNYGEKPIDYAAFTMYPGQARQERLVTNLAPGTTTIKRYRFDQAQFTAGATVRSGIKEIYGTRILNDEVPIQ
ncbi:MAG: hypothetical protein IT448_10230 [Phycisphaerales bacterium]|nr:hypothetical protein [Phycisphaerales bacterium]